MEINVKTLPIKVNKKRLESHWWFRLCRVIYKGFFFSSLVLVPFIAYFNSQIHKYNGLYAPSTQSTDWDKVVFYSVIGAALVLIVFNIAKSIVLYVLVGNREENDSI